CPCWVSLRGRGSGHPVRRRAALRGGAQEAQSRGPVRSLSGRAPCVLLRQSPPGLQEGGRRGRLEALRRLLRQVPEGLSAAWLIPGRTEREAPGHPGGVREQPTLERELDLDPGTAAEAAAQAREGVGEPHLPAVLRPERGVGALDGKGLGEETGARLVPLTADAPACVRRRDSRARGTTEAPDPAR